MTHRLGAAAVTLVALFTCAAAAAPPSLPPGPATVLRLAQAGYAVGSAKTAYFMGPVRAFEVTDGAGDTVLAGTTGTSRGRWNAAYPAVRPIDLSTVDTPGHYRLTVEGASPAGFEVSEDPAGPLATAMTGFLTSQRDSWHDLDHDAQLHTPQDLEALPSYADVSGGWFDAGDYLKFTATASYALVCLQIAERTNPALADEIEYGLDWLRRMWDPDTGVLRAQVGLGDGVRGLAGDHDVWRLPQTDDGRTGDEVLLARRPVFAANRAGEPVSGNLAGRTAAAFALSARRDAVQDPDLDLDRARADLDRAAGLYAAAGGDLVTAFPAEYYPETSGDDDLELAAAELFRAARALDDPRAEQWHADARRLAVTWPDATADEPTLHLYDTTALAHLELGDDDLVADVGRRLDGARLRAAADPFGAGASYTGGDATARILGVAATAALYSGVTGDRRPLADAWAQVGWVLGANAWGTSFVVGAGEVYPRCPQHPVANLTGAEPTGAVVAGPAAVKDFIGMTAPDGAKPCRAGGFDRYTGRGARYVDDVAAWPSVEPTLDATATGILALSVLAG